MANTRSLVVSYLLYFMFVGVTLPFLPVYLRTLGLEPAAIGVLLSTGPFFALVAPPLWGQLADRTGRPGVVLLVLSAGSLVGFAVLLGATSFAGVLGALAIFASFNAATTTLLDSLALAAVQRHGGSFARLRTFGSLGFVVSTLAFGFGVDAVDRRVVVVALALIAAFTGWALATLARAPPVERRGPRANLSGAFALLRDPQLRWLLLSSATHWVASAPYHGSLGLHFSALAFPPSTLGLSSSVAVTSEVLVLATWPRWSHRLSPRAVLLVAFAASACRWAAMGLTTSQGGLVALAALHGLSFGAFYVASISWVAARSPESLRATGQALFVAATFGLGGLVGFTGAGQLYERLGGQWLFLVAAAAELLPAAIAWWRLGDPGAPRTNPAPGAAPLR
ncbi:MAG: MFS transporter [Myxococcaceae bacterium]|nr:MFS transporter [Myxococcaceae bacterium]